MNTLKLALRQLRRHWRAGQVRILLAATVLAVLAMSAVGFVTDRAQRALALQANRLLGGDAVVRGDAPLAATLYQRAADLALQHSETVEFNSMLRLGEGENARVQLGELRALGEGFPLRGSFRIVNNEGIEHDAGAVPAPGTVWLSRQGADTLDARLGETIYLGQAAFTLTALVIQEPDAVLDYFNIAPRVFLNLADLPATELIQEGSRVRYRLVVAGQADAVEQFVSQTRGHLQRGQRIETISDARPEIRSALQRANRFLGLAALVAVILAAIAVAMAARQHSQRQLTAVAVLRCMGAQQRTVLAIHLGELVFLGLFASTLGVILAFALQWMVGSWLASVLKISIPPASLWPIVRGYAVGLVVLLAFAAPPLLALRRVPALRVLRRDIAATQPSAWWAGLSGLAGLIALLWWQAASVSLALTMLGGLTATLAVLMLLAWALIVLLRRIRPRLRGPLRYGLANLSRRSGLGIAQISALGLGLMALLLLTLVRTDLLDRWQLSLAQNAPNRFIINVQPAQIETVRDFINARGLGEAQLWPMVRARLLEHNGKPVRSQAFAKRHGSADDNERNRRRAEREFNLSTAAQLRADNHITDGQFWQKNLKTTELSVEHEFAKGLGWKVGDVITFDIAGQRFSAPISSLRRVDWESFNPNFFVLVSPGALDAYPASHITAVHVPDSDTRFTAELVQQLPNLSVINIDAVLTQLRNTADQVSTVVQVVFWFSLIAGVLVLLAAVSASQDERLREGALMRALGASRWQLRWAQISEFAAIGLLSGLVAAVSAMALSAVIAHYVLELPWLANPLLALIAAALGMLITVLAGLCATGSTLSVPPALTLRQIHD